MTQKYSLLIITLLSFGWLNSQNSENKITLRDGFDQIEAAYGCSFSFVDKDLLHHIFPQIQSNTLKTVLEELQEKTLFSFTRLEDNTVAVVPKPNRLYVCAQLNNSRNNSPIPNVLITTAYQELSTNEMGEFGAWVLSVSDVISCGHITYDTKEILSLEITEQPCIQLFLDEKIESLSLVTISNYLVKGIKKNANGSISINYDEFDILPGLIESDVLQTLQALPGIQSVNETVSFINIRGGTHDQNLILWDGIKMYQSGHFFGLISAFNPYLTKEIDLYKNGSSAEFGDGVSGVISMKGENHVDSKFEASWGINLINMDAFINQPLGSKASIEVSGRKSFNTFLETPTYDAYFSKAFQNTEVVTTSETERSSDANFTFYDTSLRFQFRPNKKNYIRANLLVLGNRLEFLENAVVDNVSLSRESDLFQNNVSGGVFFGRKWSNQFDSDIQLYVSGYQVESTNIDILNNQALQQENSLSEVGFKLKNTIQFSTLLKGIIGYQLNETGITNSEKINNPFFERTEKQVIRTNSLFSELNFSNKNNQTNFNLGLRANHYSKFNEIRLEPRFSFSQRFLDYFTFDMLGELKSQSTSQIIDFQDDFLGVENRRWVLSNPEAIPIIKSAQISSGLSYNQKGLLISADLYLKDVKGITTQSQGFQNQFQNNKTHGSYFIKGVDILVNKQFKKLKTWLSYSYAQNTYTFENLQPQKFPNNIDIRHTLTYGINYSWKSFKLSGGLNWHSGKPTTSVNLDNQITIDQITYNRPNNAHVDDYLRVDASCLYNFSLGKNIRAVAGISLWNIFNKRNILTNFFRINHNDNLEEVNEYSLRFTPNATFRLFFN